MTSRLTPRARPRAALVFAALLAAPAVLAAAPQASAAAPQAQAVAAPQAQVPVETFTLDNGMRFLLVRKPELATVSGGWVARVGAANERPGITGVTHLFEHMMFKGTRTIGTTNITRDLQIIDEQEALQERIRAIYEEQRARWRRGEIDDPFSSANRPPELVELEKKFQALIDEQRSLMVKDEFDKIYTAAGGSGMNAFTNQDMTVYFITVPSNKLELWFWMESDRLTNLVLREFYSERDVVNEERRLRTESTPTGKYEEAFDAMFWTSHPYKWGVIGWPSDLRVISKAQAEEYYRTHYGAQNLTAALVGNFDVAQVKELAQKYFGRIARSEKPAPPVTTLEMEPLAEKRMRVECDCQPQVEVRYHTVPFKHKDGYALDVLAGLMNGRTGRLTKSQVLDQKIATSAGTGQNGQKWAGYFSYAGEVKADATPERLEQSWYAELKKIIDEPIPDDEMQKVKNQIAGTSYRRLVSPFFLLVQLLVNDGLGDWRELNEETARTLAVTADDVKRVARTYLTPERRAVASYYRKAGTSAEPEIDLSAVPEQARPMVKQQLKKIRELSDPAQVEQQLAQVRAQKDSVPEQFKKILPLFEKALEDRLAELKAQNGGKQ